VDRVLGNFGEPLSILDPFSGTGTTLLAGMTAGHNCRGIDLNPFLVWLANTKINRYSDLDLGHCRSLIRAVVDAVLQETVQAADPPPIHNIERWWHQDTLDSLCLLKAAIDRDTGPGTKIRDLTYVAFCRTLIVLSNAAFNHQSMSFGGAKARQRPSRAQCVSEFEEAMAAVLSSLTPDPTGGGEVVLGDARTVSAVLRGKYDLLLTSPPYPNRMSYIRELRPYMYWLGYLHEAREAGELDWQAIGGTWGSATSNLTQWTPEADLFEPQYLGQALGRIAKAHSKNGNLLATYVRKYCQDMWQHVRSVVPVMKRGSRVVYIVGNSSFYGVLVPVDRFYADMLTEAGFVDVHVETLRKRNSKKELYEFAVEGCLGFAAAASPVSRSISGTGQLALFERS